MMYEDFKQRKEAGQVKVLKNPTDELITIEAKQFDPKSGEPTDPYTMPVNKSQLTAQKEALEKQLADINEVLKEFEGTK